MKKRQVRNNGVKQNRKLNIDLNNKNGRINTKSLPTFILIGLIIMLIIIAIIYYVFLRYAPEMIITYSGYAVEGKSMVENLKNSDASNVNPYLGLIGVHENDLLYKRLNSYYIGQDDKKEIDINYPIYINEGNALLNIGPNTRLITVNYEEVEGYPDFMMTDGVMYNGADITRADGNKYIFLKSEDEIYTNVGKIKINTTLNEYEIKEFSNIYFTEDYIAYYEMQDDSDVQNWYMQYKRINDIDMDSKIEVNNETMTYKTFLERLGIIQAEENNINVQEENTVENETEESTVEEPNEEIKQEQNNESNTTNENKPDEQEWQEDMWEKPTVSCTDFESGVYTISTNLSVTDRAGVISRGVIFEIYLDGRLNRRALATQIGNIEITNLQPDTEFEIRGIFYYYDENGEEQVEEFYNGTVKTKPISALGTIDFSFQNGEIYSNKIELIHLKLNNDLNEEVIKGISRIQVEIGDVAFRLSNTQIDELKAGEEITYQTSESLTSNSKIKYKITAFDRFGNELKTINNKGETITSKQSPRVSITATKQDVTEVILDVTLNNKDNVDLENYKYEITNQSGDIVKQGILGNNGTANDGSKETLTFNDLDPNGYYQIIIYGDYDLDNGEGMQQNAGLGRASFVTGPLASLGYMQVHIDDKEVTQNSMNLGISIDENQTDARLLAILDEVEVVIYGRGKNISNDNGNNDGNSDNEEKTDNGENSESSRDNDVNDDNESSGDSESENDDQSGTLDNTQQETEVQRITFTDEQVQSLKTDEEVELNLDQLNSNTKYRIDVITTVKQGLVEQVVEDKQNLEQLITLKMPAEVQVRNQFVIGTMIDLDIRIEDPDNAVLTNQVRIEVRDKDNKLIDLSEMPTNAEYERKTYEDLNPNETYRIIVYAPQYNEGSTDATYEADYILKEKEIVTETGISGNLDLIGLEKTPTGKNLIDVSSKVNWYEKCFNTYEAYGLNYDENTNILSLGGNENTNHLKQTYYDLSKYLGQEITISFKARTKGNTYIQIIEKSNTDFNDTNFTEYYRVNDLSSDWKEYSYTVTLSKTGYIGFRINDYNVTIEMQELQAELGNRKTDYEEFKYDYNANIAITVNDARNEIITNDYYIRIYKNDEQIQEIRYEEIGEDNKVENVQKTYNIEPDANYRIELLVKMADRYYELDSQEFSTEGVVEIKGISNLNDYLKIQPYGTYIILQDLDFSNTSFRTTMFGMNDILLFNGRVNYNGKTVVINAKEGSRLGLFREVGNNGIIENLVLDIKFDNETAIREYCGLAYINRGIIRNLQLNIIEANERYNTYYQLVSYINYGTIEMFAINFEKSIYIDGNGTGSVVVTFNRGITQNGYIIGKNIKVTAGTSSSCGIIVNTNENNGVIRNLYSLVSVDLLEESSVSKKMGNIASNNNGNATVQNVYSVGIGENTTDFTTGPNIYSKSSKKVYNNYYFSDEIFTSELENKGNELSLWDTTFQNQLINADGAFIVDELVSQGYFPHLNMSDVMPAQEYIELPEVEDADLPDILSTKVLEQGTNTVKVQFSVNNPSAEQISEIKIENIDVEILSQEYNNGKSTVVAELKNPIICVSSYDVLSISTKGAFNSTYTRTYTEGERVINVDLYKEIWNVNDWKKINDSPTENYMLMTNLNFINEGNTISISSITGIINGNGHTISNINLTYNTSLINEMVGTLKNIYIDNFYQEATSYGGACRVIRQTSTLNGVHVSNVKIIKTSGYYSGGLVVEAYGGVISNSSISNISITTEGSQSSIRIGGFIGTSNNVNIDNCFVRNLNIVNEANAVSTEIGGLIGYATGSNRITNCYTEGNISSYNSNVGGLTGNFSLGNLENCYSKVNISTTNINIGGISGTATGGDASSFSNNVSIGNLYTTSGMDNLDRIAGFGADSENNNYAYENQLLNGYKSTENKGATLLSKDEILELNLGNAYNYDKASEGILPKLYNTEGSELLPNQEDIFLDDNSEEGTVTLEVESIDAEKPNSTESEITVRINNPQEVEITGLQIEDMTIAGVIRNATQNGITSITVRAIPNRYYDSYKLTGIKYKILSEEQLKEVENEIIVQFYKEIYTYEDWQSIEESTYQNYRLMADIDFSGRTNIKNNITANRLEAENNIFTLSNIELEFNSENTGLINNIRTSIKNIGFENITIHNTAGSGSYAGVIATASGDIENLNFSNITVKASGLDYVGMIGMISSGSVRNIKLDTVNITAASRVGGFAGDYGNGISNVNANNVLVSASKSYAGGVIGRAYDYTGSSQSNINVINSNINGVDYVGGITGYISGVGLTRSSVTDTYVYGKGSYAGGMSGYIWNNGIAGYYNSVTSCEISAVGQQIGGLAGHSEAYERNGVVKDTIIRGNSVNSDNVGGVAGVQRLMFYNCSVKNCDISTLGDVVGGISGRLYANSNHGPYECYVKNTKIEGDSEVGGLVGEMKNGPLNGCLVNAELSAISHTVGGLIGYMENSTMTTAVDIIQMKRSGVVDTTIEAPTKVGGLVRRCR